MHVSRTYDPIVITGGSATTRLSRLAYDKRYLGGRRKYHDISVLRLPIYDAKSSALGANQRLSSQVERDVCNINPVPPRPKLENIDRLDRPYNEPVIVLGKRRLELIVNVIATR